MFVEIVLDLLRVKGISKNKMLSDLKLGANSFVNWSNRGTIPNASTVAKIAEYFNVPSDYLLGKIDKNDMYIWQLQQKAQQLADETVAESSNRYTEDLLKLVGAFDIGKQHLIPIIGEVCAGVGCFADENIIDYDFASVNNSDKEYFYLKVKGNSMAPTINDGDLALFRCQSDVDSGDLAIVVLDDEYGMIKKVIKKDGAIILQPFNSEYDTIFINKDSDINFRVIGKVLETKRKW